MFESRFAPLRCSWNLQLICLTVGPQWAPLKLASCVHLPSSGDAASDLASEGTTGAGAANRNRALGHPEHLRDGLLVERGVLGAAGDLDGVAVHHCGHCTLRFHVEVGLATWQR